MFKPFVVHFFVAASVKLMFGTADVTLAEDVGPKWMRFPMHATGNHIENIGSLSNLSANMYVCLPLFSSGEYYAVISDRLYLRGNEDKCIVGRARLSVFARHKDTAELPDVKLESIESGHVWVLAEC